MAANAASGMVTGSPETAMVITRATTPKPSVVVFTSTTAASK
jgi:hypothetical protein